MISKVTQFLILGLLALLATAAAATESTEPWMNRVASPEARTRILLKQMTLDEKLQLVFGYFSTTRPEMNWVMPDGGIPFSDGFIPGIPRLNIPPQWQIGASMGVTTQAGTDTPRERTAFPATLALAATFNRVLAYEDGKAIGNETFLSGFNVQLGGAINLARDPHGGRNFEYSGEDPLLAGSIVGEQIRGVQSSPLVATIKHFALNDQETNRYGVDSQIDKAAARMSDLLAFELAIERGNPGAVMCSYNLVNGTYSCENDWLLNQVLKRDWGFRGYVMSDWGATHSTVAAANSGLDQESGFPFDSHPFFQDALRTAVANGQVTLSRLDNMVSRILLPMFANRLFDAPAKGDQSVHIDYAAHAKVSQACAEEGIVLLKNSGALPLRSNLKKIALIGGHADVGVLSGGGSSQVYPIGGMPVPNEGPTDFPGPMVYYPSSPMKALESKMRAAFRFDSGKDPAAAAKLAAASDVALVFVTEWNGESLDSPSLTLPNGQDQLIVAVAKANPHTVVVMETGNPVWMPWLDQVEAVIEAWYPGSSGGEAIANVLTGAVNPSGHLPLTFPANEQQLPRQQISDQIADYKVEGAAVGYKWYQRQGYRPLFPFGYGLSYTTFEISKSWAYQRGSHVYVSFRMKNTGHVTGQAVAQVYASPERKTVWEAPARLVGFHKAKLKPGQSSRVNVEVDLRLLATFNESKLRWEIGAGKYKFGVGYSSDRVGHGAELALSAMDIPAGGRPQN